MDQNRCDYFCKIYDDTNEQILKYILIRCNEYEEIKDIFQNVYTNFYERVLKYGKVHFTNAKGYLIRIAKDELAKYYKSKDIHKEDIPIEIEDEDYMLIDESSSIEERLLASSQMEEIWGLIKTKGIVTLKIFILYYLYDYKLKQISSELNIPESTVKNKLYQTLKEIKKKHDEC